MGRALRGWGALQVRPPSAEVVTPTVNAQASPAQVGSTTL